MVVEASAGSGKTESLAKRMAAGIAGGIYTVEHMAAVTFTRKAAAELRGRFQLALEKALEDAGAGAAGSDSELRAARLRHALSNLERFFAGTIHAFCARLLRERPVEAGVSPGFTELDDAEDQLLREQSWRDYRAQANSSADPDLMELVNAGVTARQLDKAFEKICLFEDVTFPAGDAPMPDAEAAWEALRQFREQMKARLPVPIPDESTCKIQERAGRFERQWRAYLRGERDPALLANLLGIWQSKPDVTQTWWGKTPADARRRAMEAKQLHAEALKSMAGNMDLPGLNEALGKLTGDEE